MLVLLLSPRPEATLDCTADDCVIDVQGYGLGGHQPIPGPRLDQVYSLLQVSGMTADLVLSKFGPADSNGITCQRVYRHGASEWSMSLQ
eukprot:61388-Rhodomonas_salina.5